MPIDMTALVSSPGFWLGVGAALAALPLWLGR